MTGCVFETMDDLRCLTGRRSARGCGPVCRGRCAESARTPHGRPHQRHVVRHDGSAPRATCCSESIRRYSSMRPGSSATPARVIARDRSQRTRAGAAVRPARDGAAAVVDDGSTYRMLGLRRGAQPRRARIGRTGVGGAASRSAAFRTRLRATIAAPRRADSAFPRTRLATRAVRSCARTVRRRNALTKLPTMSIRRSAIEARVVAESLGPRGMIHGDGKVTNLLFDEHDRVVRGARSRHGDVWRAQLGFR